MYQESFASAWFIADSSQFPDSAIRHVNSHALRSDIVVWTVAFVYEASRGILKKLEAFRFDASAGKIGGLKDSPHLRLGACETIHY